jgi:broad specificity phosphatase PhoE
VRLLCLRHGETNYNRLGLCNDDLRDDVHLTERGREQAARAAERLKSEPIGHIFVSQLPRTRETAEIIKEALIKSVRGELVEPRTDDSPDIAGIARSPFDKLRANGKLMPITAHAALNDIRSGFNGRPVADYFAATGHDRLHARVNGGESLLDYKARVLPFLDGLCGRSEHTVLVVAHEETLRILAAHFRGLGDEAMERLVFANCEIVEFTL